MIYGLVHRRREEAALQLGGKARILGYPLGIVQILHLKDITDVW